MRFQDQVAVVTGAGNGIGLQIARSFAAEGARLVIAEINPASGERAAADIRAQGGQAHFIQVDVADEPSVQSMVAGTLSHWGQIDILVNNAGVVAHKLLVDMDLPTWQRQIDVQLTGPFLTSKHVGRHLIERGQAARSSTSPPSRR